MDFFLLLLPSLALGLLATTHVRLVAGLALQGQKLRALVALVVPPLAPFWGWQLGQRAWATAWGLLLAAYAIFLGLASRG